MPLALRYAIAVIVIVLDQLTKVMADRDPRAV